MQTMSQSDSAPTVQAESKRIIQKNFDEFRTWPRNGLFSAEVVVDGSNGYGLIQRADRHNVIERIGKVRLSASRNSCQRTSIWRLTDEALDVIHDYRDNRTTQLPCDHVGYTNTGDWIKCKECGGRFTPEEVKSYQQW